MRKMERGTRLVAKELFARRVIRSRRSGVDLGAFISRHGAVWEGDDGFGLIWGASREALAAMAAGERDFERVFGLIWGDDGEALAARAGAETELERFVAAVG